MNKMRHINLRSALRALAVSIALIAFFVGLFLVYNHLLSIGFDKTKTTIGVILLMVIALTLLMSNSFARRLRNEHLAKQLSSTADIYISLHEVDFENDTFTEVINKSKESLQVAGETKRTAQELVREVYSKYADDSTRGDILDFIDFSKIDSRLKDTNTITCEFKNYEGKWRRARFIVSGRAADGKVTNAMYVVEDIDAERTERDKLGERLLSISTIFNTVHEINLTTDTFSEIKNGSKYARDITGEGAPNAQETLRYFGRMVGDPSMLGEMDRFFDFSTLPQRLKDTDTVTSEFKNKDGNWLRAKFIAAKRDSAGKPTHLLYLTEYITAEKAERDRLVDASERALAASEAKSSFLSNMSHEIRTPINAVLGMNEMILRECDDQNILRYSESIRTAGSTLLGLVNDILDFSKIEAGKMEIIPVDYDLSSVINDLVNMIQTKADAKGLKLELEIDKKVPKLLHGDEVRIKQVVTNILTNAVKYTEKGIVTLCLAYEIVSDDPDSVMLNVAVKDTGIGIKQEDMQKLFSEFDRIEEERNRHVEGTGLGMSITKRLLEMMGSSLQVESIYGLGSKFSFSLKQTVVKWEEIGDYEAAYKASLASRGKYHERFRAPEARILVVDDTPMNLEVITNLLKTTGVKIETAESGEEALSLAFDKKYDVIFLDHMMPDKDGIETLQEMRSRTNDPNLGTPVICLTANAISGAREKYLAAGFDNYLTKPIDSVKLEEMLISYLPEEKVLTSEPEPEAETPGNERTPALPDCIRAISEIDTQAGIKNCGDIEGYLNTIKIYARTVKDNADALEQFWKDWDLKNVTIKIHALKSSSRIIGAAGLGELAQDLENAGNDRDLDKIGAGIDELLSRYRKIGEELSPLLSDEEPDESNLKAISEDELKELYTAIKEFISVSDYDSVIDLIERLKDYRVPDKEQNRRQALIEAADEIRYEDIKDILEKEDAHV